MSEAGDNEQSDVVKEAVRRFVDGGLEGNRLDIEEFVKDYPGSESQIRKGIQELQRIDALFDSLTVEENVLMGGFGSAVLECLADNGVHGSRIHRVGLPGKERTHRCLRSSDVHAR